MKSIKLSKGEIEKLRSILTKKGFKFESSKSKYEDFRVSQANIRFILYKSRNLVYADNKETINIIMRILDKEQEFEYLIGSDETGKGEWYGPLVVVAIGLKTSNLNKLRLVGVKDSKTLKTRQIERIAENLIKQKFLLIEKIILLPEKYNELYKEFLGEDKNLNDILAWAHSKVIKEILSRIESKKLKIKVTIDKFDSKKLNQRIKNIDLSSIKIIQKEKGEQEIPVATASIIAKYYFEQTILELNKKYKVNLKEEDPRNLKKSILKYVAKIHFSNVPV